MTGTTGTAADLVDRVPFGGDGEGKALADEPDVGSAQVVEGPEEDPHPGVVTDATVHLEREGPPAGRCRHVGYAGRQQGGQGGNHLVGQGGRPPAPGQAEHGRLLLQLLAAADHAQRRMGGGGRQHAGQLVGHHGEEVGVVRGVEEGEHGVLPHHQAELVAQGEERLVLVDRPAGDPDHVHPGLLHQGQRSAEVLLGRLAGHRVEGIPATAPAEHRRPVDRHTEAAVHRVHGEGPESHAPQLEAGGTEAHGHRIEGLGPVGVGPPAVDPVEGGRAGEAQVAGLGVHPERDGDASHLEGGPLGGAARPLLRGHRQLHRDRPLGRPVLAGGAAGQEPTIDHPVGGPRDQSDRAPRTDRGRRHRPSGLAAQQGGPEPPEVLVGGPVGLPARTRALGRQPRRDGGEPDDQFVAGRQ